MWQEAVDDFRSVLKIDPSDTSAQQYLATAMEEGRLQMVRQKLHGIRAMLLLFMF